MLVDDHELIRQGLRRAFERDAEFQVVGEAASLADARRIAETGKPDVAVIDVRLPDGSGLELAQSLRASRPEVGLVILTMYAGDDQLFAALDAGASAFVPKSAPSDDVVAAARHAAARPSSFIAADLAEAMHRKLNPSGPQLTRREREVLGLLADGLGVSNIARKLYISESTTKTHVSKLYEKLGAANRAQAIMAAVRAGLLDDSATST
ncbi:DNA-binding response regulator [Actinobacteria bacterium YIM 96077]|uniref:DNA-binding response regulator n=1 Tax=Phytoactinopolyspora halophila TaxID=1981511 RepID=A0A329QHQ4_9ACTN|nr:DNA-binding response regulator [Actinobacteria bacterium YIM 96077]RAW11269.1 DNA-binding response regulator [Phytoactinopolyspora halophila]